MNSKHIVHCADDGIEYIFLAETPMQAMEKMLYTENVKRLDVQAKISSTKSGLVLIHNGKTYWCRVPAPNGNGRNLYIDTNNLGQKVASFISKDKRVRRLLTPKEAEYARQLIVNNDTYGIDSFCYGIA